MTWINPNEPMTWEKLHKLSKLALEVEDEEAHQLFRNLICLKWQEMEANCSHARLDSESEWAAFQCPDCELWVCEVGPKKCCVYTESRDDCDQCHEPEERK